MAHAQPLETAPGRSIVVTCAADRKYLRPLAVTLRSLIAHLEPGRTLAIHAIDGNIPDAEKALLARSVCTPTVTLSWHVPDRSRLLGVPLWGRMPISVYDKLLVPDLLPPDVDQAVWLDSDTLVLADVAPLWDGGTSGRPVLAVQDTLVPLVSARFGVARYRELGLRNEAKYFNAGVMLMNLGLWRQRQVTDRALEYLKEYAGDVSFWDQEGLNAVLADEWGELDQAWNWSVSVGRTPGWGRRRLPSDAAPEPRIVHFSGNLKPWTYPGVHPFYGTYYRYVDGGPWPGWRPRRSWRTAAVSVYEQSALRRVLRPLERFGTALWMTLTRRVATAADLQSA